MRCIFSPEENNACYLFLVLIYTPPSPLCQAVMHFMSSFVCQGHTFCDISLAVVMPIMLCASFPHQSRIHAYRFFSPIYSCFRNFSFSFRNVSTQSAKERPFSSARTATIRILLFLMFFISYKAEKPPTKAGVSSYPFIIYFPGSSLIPGPSGNF